MNASGMRGVADAHGRSFQWMSRYSVTWPRVPRMNVSHALQAAQLMPCSLIAITIVTCYASLS